MSVTGPLRQGCTCPACRTKVEIRLSVPEQRRIIEANTGEPCFRMWMTTEEFAGLETKDWTASVIDNGHVAVWRKRSDVAKLLASSDPEARELGIKVQSRELLDVSNGG
jgi:hypothetical protein